MSAKLLAEGVNPIDAMLICARELARRGELEAAIAGFAKVAPYVASKFAPAPEPARLHPPQKPREQLELAHGDEAQRPAPNRFLEILQ